MILFAQQQNHLLLPKYQPLPWGNPRYQSLFTTQLVAQLTKVTAANQIATLVRRVLSLLFVPQFFETDRFQSFEQQILSCPVAAADASSANNSSQSAETEQKPLLPQPSESAVVAPAETLAILLLDGENTKLTAVEEQFLEKCCRHPIQIKIAFANWRNMGRYDAEFYGRGYQMIHVPAGKNNADFQMTAIGASLFLLYPAVREVFVCSGDTDFTPLCNHLQNYGLVVYSVRRRGEYLIVTHRATGQVRACVSGKGINPRIDIERKITSLLEEITAYEPGTYIDIMVLNNKFKKQYGRSITELLKELHIETKYMKFLKSCNFLKLQQNNQNWEITLAKA